MSVGFIFKIVIISLLNLKLVINYEKLDFFVEIGKINSNKRSGGAILHPTLLINSAKCVKK